MQIFQAFLNLNIWVCKTIDLALPRKSRIDGHDYFRLHVLPKLITSDLNIMELGGGSRPYLSPKQKHELGVTVTGLDIEIAELNAAPPGSYDHKIATDLCRYRGAGRADLVICQATLEHVPDVSGAVKGCISSARDGGIIAIFAPSRNALFARVNLFLPQKLKRWILFKLFPNKADGHEGFQAYYDRCVPSSIQSLFEEGGCEVLDKGTFWTSSYFRILVPMYFVWRSYQAISIMLLRNDAAESFFFVFRVCRTTHLAQAGDAATYES